VLALVAEKRGEGTPAAEPAAEAAPAAA